MDLNVQSLLKWKDILTPKKVEAALAASMSIFGNKYLYNDKSQTKANKPILAHLYVLGSLDNIRKYLMILSIDLKGIINLIDWLVKL